MRAHNSTQTVYVSKVGIFPTNENGLLQGSRAQQTLSFKGKHDLFTAQIWPFYISAQSSSEAKISTPLHDMIRCKSITWAPPFPYTFSSYRPVNSVRFLEYTKISHGFCLSTSSHLPEMHPTFLQQIHTHSLSSISRTSSPVTPQLTSLGSPRSPPVSPEKG